MADDRPATLGDIAELRGTMDAGFRQVNRRLDTLADGYVTPRLCQERHAASDAAIEAAVSASMEDRNKLWTAHRDNAYAIVTEEAERKREVGEVRKAYDRLLWAVAAGSLTLLINVLLQVGQWLVERV